MLVESWRVCGAKENGKLSLDISAQTLVLRLSHYLKLNVNFHIQIVSYVPLLKSFLPYEEEMETARENSQRLHISKTKSIRQQQLKRINKDKDSRIDDTDVSFLDYDFGISLHMRSEFICFRAYGPNGSGTARVLETNDLFCL